MSLFTVVIPTHDHADTLLCAVERARAQDGVELEILIVGDGAPDRTRELAAALVRDDARIRYFDRPKGERHGERHRHEALREARGRFVAYLADDDLWLPDHLETLAAALAHADLAHTIAINADPEGRLTLVLVDAAAPGYAGTLRTNRAGFSPSCAGHTLAAYRRLPHGWRPAPPGINSDAWMWLQFLEQPGLRVESVPRATVLRLPATARAGWTPAERRAELDRWWAEISPPAGVARLRERALEALARERVRDLDGVRRDLDAERAEVARLRDVVRGLEQAARRPFRARARAAAARLRAALIGGSGGAR